MTDLPVVPVVIDRVPVWLIPTCPASAAMAERLAAAEAWQPSPPTA